MNKVTYQKVVDQAEKSQELIFVYSRSIKDPNLQELLPLDSLYITGMSSSMARIYIFIQYVHMLRNPNLYGISMDKSVSI